MTRSVTEIVESKLEEFKTTLKEERDELRDSLIDALKDEIRSEFVQLMESHTKRIDELESTVAILHTQVDVLKQQIDVSINKTDDLEQYGRRQCLRLNGMPPEKDETAEDVLEKVKKALDDAEVLIPDNIIDRAHRIGSVYKDRDTGEDAQSVIVKFSTFKHRSIVYRARKKLKLIVRPDLTKRRYDLLHMALKAADKSAKVKYVYVDINCRLKARMADDSEVAFDSLEKINSLC